MQLDSRADSADEWATRARYLARAGRPEEAADAWREASRGYIGTGRPLQAIAAALEASGPRANATDAALAVARIIVPPVERASAQQILCEIELPAREALVGRLHPVAFSPDEVVAREGDPAEAVWFVVRGRLRAERRRPSGSSQPAGVAGAGAVVGESAVLAATPRLATLISEGETQLLELRRRDLEALRAVWPSVWQALAAVQRLETSSGRQHVRA